MWYESEGVAWLERTFPRDGIHPVVAMNGFFSIKEDHEANGTYGCAMCHIRLRNVPHVYNEVL